MFFTELKKAEEYFGIRLNYLLAGAFGALASSNVSTLRQKNTSILFHLTIGAILGSYITPLFENNKIPSLVIALVIGFVNVKVVYYIADKVFPNKKILKNEENSK